MSHCCAHQVLQFVHSSAVLIEWTELYCRYAVRNSL